jgi:hypothetical protein
MDDETYGSCLGIGGWSVLMACAWSLLLLLI